MAALVGARVGRLTDLIARGNPFLIDAERFLDRLWPNIIPERFEDLELPLLAVATDYSARTEAVFHKGRLLPAVAGWMAIPGLVKPGRHGEHLLVDGGAVNPLPFDHLIDRDRPAVCGRCPRRPKLPADSGVRRLRDDVWNASDHAGRDCRGEAQ